MNIVVESERDRRTLNWLIDQVGLPTVERACSQLAGERRAYVSNVAKVLGLRPPDSVCQTGKSEALAHLASIKGILKSKRCPK